VKLIEACAAIAATRENRAIVATMGAMRAFDLLGCAEARLSSVPLMGGAASLGLGLALARPDVGVIVVDGDASLLMQLGVLVAVADAAPRNYIHFVANNGSQFTGGFNLPIPGSGNVDFPGLARAAGYRCASRFADEAALREALPALFAADGPIFVELAVEGEPPRFGAQAPQPEMPDLQFTRMGTEATRLANWYQGR
jgi:thiamine pyrophosphate-dependent acetolactate synthase large subunit-like protein